MSALFSSPSIPAPAAPPPLPNPPILANAATQNAGAQTRLLASQAAGSGFDNTELTSPIGAPTPDTAKKTLGGT